MLVLKKGLLFLAFALSTLSFVGNCVFDGHLPIGNTEKTMARKPGP